MVERKNDHIQLAFQSQMELKDKDPRFYYEPILNPHPPAEFKPFTFLGKEYKVPLWISSMTGGAHAARAINSNLARVCKEFGFGMGLGSCRIILKPNNYFKDFDIRDIIGDSLPLYANLGISQIEEAILNNQVEPIKELVKRLRADGLIIHVNPIQEWFQPEGDKLEKPPVETITRLLEKVDFKVIVKEVGQGMGPASLRLLLKLPLAAIEFAAYGGTNFAKVELMRSDSVSRQLFEPFAAIGEDAYSMTDYINRIVEEESDKILCKEIIISGGIRHFLDGYYLIRKSKLPAIYGQASAFLKYANSSYEELRKYIQLQIKGLQFAYAFLNIRE